MIARRTVLVLAGAALAGGLIGHLVAQANRPAATPAVVHVVIDRPEVAAPPDIELLLVEPVLGPEQPDEAEPADNP